MIMRILLLLSIAILAACNADEPDAPEPTEIAALEGDPTRGEHIFRTGVNETAPPCSTCHRVDGGVAGLGLGPGLADIGMTAAERVDGLSAEDYIRASILMPGDVEIPGFRVSMYMEYDAHLSEQDLADLLAYLLTL